MQQRTEFHVDGRFSYGAIGFSPDGLWLATGAGAGAVQLWDAQTGKQVGDSGRHQGHVYTLGFGRDSRTLVSEATKRALATYGICDRLPTTRRRIPRGCGTIWPVTTALRGPTRHLAHCLILPDRAVQLVAEKLRQVKSIVDPAQLSDEKSPEAAQRLDRLKKRLADNDPQIASAVTVRRAISLLAKIGTPAATRLLEDMQNRDVGGPLGQIAAAALKRVRRSRL